MNASIDQTGRVLTIDCTGLPYSKLIQFQAISSEVFLAGANLETKCQAIVIGTASGHTSQALLEKIRTNTELANLPVLATNEAVADHPLCDGLFSGRLDESIATFGRRMKSVSIDTLGTIENRILCYLWALPSRQLTPDGDLKNPQFYNYPLLELWSPDVGAQWIADAERRGLIAQDRVINRLRHCAGCESPYLNYVDLCPHCQSVEIENVRALHCFACGHVGDQEAFYRAQKLVCPKCQASLKHIGADYDRPIETHLCNGCGQRFLEAEVRCSCLACGRLNNQEDLQTRSVATYKITPAGIEYLRTGTSPQAVPLVLGEPVGQEHFFWMLKWLNETAQPGHDAPYMTALIFEDQNTTKEADAKETAITDLVRVQLLSLLAPEDILTMLAPRNALILFPNDGEAKQQEFEAGMRKIMSQSEHLGIDVRSKSSQLPNPELVIDPLNWVREQLAGGSD